MRHRCACRISLALSLLTLSTACGGAPRATRTQRENEPRQAESRREPRSGEPIRGERAREQGGASEQRGAPPEHPRCLEEVAPFHPTRSDPQLACLASQAPSGRLQQLRRLQTLWVDRGRIQRRSRWALLIPAAGRAELIDKLLQGPGRTRILDRDGQPLTRQALQILGTAPMILERDEPLPTPRSLPPGRWWDGWSPRGPNEYGGAPLWSAYELSVPLNPQPRWLALSLGAPREERQQGRLTLRWNLDGQLSTTPSGSPQRAPLAPQLYISSFQSWEELDQWLAPLYQAAPTRRRVQLPQRAHLTRALTLYQGIRRRVRAELQPLRAYRPLTARETLSRGVGDCKDLNFLLLTALAEEGIPAYAALSVVGPPRPFSAELASPGWFNHLLLYLPTLSRWLDATDPLPWAASSRGRRAFLLTGAGGQLATVGAPLRTLPPLSEASPLPQGAPPQYGSQTSDSSGSRRGYSLAHQGRPRRTPSQRGALGAEQHSERRAPLPDAAHQ